MDDEETKAVSDVDATPQARKAPPQQSSMMMSSSPPLKVFSSPKEPPLHDITGSPNVIMSANNFIYPDSHLTHKMSKKIVQLTQIIAQLNERVEDLELELDQQPITQNERMHAFLGDFIETYKGEAELREQTIIHNAQEEIQALHTLLQEKEDTNQQLASHYEKKYQQELDEMTQLLLEQVTLQKSMREQHQRSLNEAKAEQDTMVQMIMHEQIAEKQSLEEEIARWQHHGEDQELRLQAVRDTLSGSEGTVMDQHRELDVLRMANAEAERMNGELMMAVQQYMASEHDRKGVIESLQTSLQTAEEDVTRLRTSLVHAQTCVQQQNEAIAEQQESVSKSLQHADQEITALTDMVIEKHNLLLTLGQTLDTLRQEKNQLQMTVSELEQQTIDQKEQLLQEIRTREQQGSENASKREELIAQMSQLIQQKEELVLAQEAKGQILVEYEATIANNNITIANNNTTIANNTTTLASNTTLIQELQQQLVILTQQTTALTQQRNDQLTHITQLQSQHTDLSQQITDLTQQNTNLTTQLSNLSHQLSTLSTTNATKDQETSSLTHQIDAVTTASLTAEIESLSTTNAALTSQIDALTSRIHLLEEMLKEKEEELRREILKFHQLPSLERHLASQDDEERRNDKARITQLEETLASMRTPGNNDSGVNDVANGNASGSLHEKEQQLQQQQALLEQQQQEIEHFHQLLQQQQLKSQQQQQQQLVEQRQQQHQLQQQQQQHEQSVEKLKDKLRLSSEKTEQQMRLFDAEKKGLNETLVSKDTTILQLQQELLLLQQSLNIAKESQTTMKKEIDDRKSSTSEDVARWCDSSVLELEGKMEAMNEQFDAACRRIASLEAEKEGLIKTHAERIQELTAHARARLQEELTHQEKELVATHVDKTANLERLLDSFKQKLKEARNDALASPGASQKDQHTHNDGKDEKNDRSNGTSPSPSSHSSSPQHKTSMNMKPDESHRNESTNNPPSATLQQMHTLQKRVDELMLNLSQNQEAMVTLSATHVHEMEQQESHVAQLNSDIEALRLALKLPEEWVVLKDRNASHRVYYFNHTTGESRWELPGDVVKAGGGSVSGRPKQQQPQQSLSSSVSQSQSQQPLTDHQQVLLVQPPSLPEGWIAMVDLGSQRTYYYNKHTGESRWKLVGVEGSSSSSSSISSRQGLAPGLAPGQGQGPGQGPGQGSAQGTGPAPGQGQGLSSASVVSSGTTYSSSVVSLKTTGTSNNAKVTNFLEVDI